MLQMMVIRAEVRELPQRRGAAAGIALGVVELAILQRSRAAGRPAVPVAQAQDPFQLGRNAVGLAVEVEDGSRDGVGEDAAQARREGDEFARSCRVDRPEAGDHRRLVVPPRERRGGNQHVDADRGTLPHGRAGLRGARTTEAALPGVPATAYLALEQQFDHEVRLQLRHGARVAMLPRLPCGIFEPHLEQGRVGAVDVRVEVRHAVARGRDVDPAPRDRPLVPLRERLLLKRLEDLLGLPPERRHGEPLRPRQQGRLRLEAPSREVFRLDDQLMGVRPRDLARLERGEGAAKHAGQSPRLGQPLLGRLNRDPQGRGELGGDRSHAQIMLARQSTAATLVDHDLGGIDLGRFHQPGENPYLPRLKPRHLGPHRLHALELLRMPGGLERERGLFRVELERSF